MLCVVQCFVAKGQNDLFGAAIGIFRCLVQLPVEAFEAPSMMMMMTIIVIVVDRLAIDFGEAGSDRGLHIVGLIKAIQAANAKGASMRLVIVVVVAVPIHRRLFR